MSASKRAKRNNRNRRSKALAPAAAPPPAVATSPPVNFVATAASFSGPIPPPSLLKEYDQIVSGGANRIIEMAEKQSAHRRDLEGKVIDSDISRSWWGLVAGFIITMAAIIGGVTVALNGQPWAGTIIAGIPTGGIIGVFVLGSSARSRERTEKALIMTGKK